VQVDPIKPTLKPTGTKHLELQYDEPPSKFSFKINLRRYNWVMESGGSGGGGNDDGNDDDEKNGDSENCGGGQGGSGGGGGGGGRGLHSFIVQLNLSRV